jgi:hypothetical protein
MCLTYKSQMVLAGGHWTKKALWQLTSVSGGHQTVYCWQKDHVGDLES